MCIKVDVDGLDTLRSAIKEFIVNNKGCFLRHIILLGYGEGGYKYESKDGDTGLIPRDSIIAHLDRLHKQHLIETPQRPTKTELFFCMCCGHEHSGSTYPATKIVAFTTDEQPDVLVTRDGCIALEDYASAMRDSNANNAVQQELGTSASQEDMDVSPLESAG